MRLEAKIKKGFYPLQLDAVPHICSLIEWVHPDANIIDPCCGKGEAVKAIADTLGIKPANIIGCELDVERGRLASELLSEGTVHAPIDFLGSSAYGDASIAYCNPPYDDEMGGGMRTETKFLHKVTGMLDPGGILIFVVPARTADNQAVYTYLKSMYESIQKFRLPSKTAKYNEVVFMAIKRDNMVINSGANWIGYTEFSSIQTRYAAKKGGKVRVRKANYTEQELYELIGKSEANSLIDGERYVRENMVPPMKMRTGHLAMLLASGKLDGIVEVEGEEPHVVRGSTAKVTVRRTEVGEETTKVIDTEVIKLTVKVATQDGRIVALTDELKTEGQEEVKSDEEAQEEEVANQL